MNCVTIPFLGLCAVLLCGCRSGDGDPKNGRSPAGNRLTFPVEAVPVENRSLLYTISAIGSVEAFEIVQVTARVSGTVEAVRFTEGQSVLQGQTLVEIEPERYRLSRESAEAALEKARAAKADAESGLARRESVSKSTPGLIPGEELETWRTRVRSAAADVAAAQAALQQAELNLRDAYVRSPFPGVIQTRSVTTGQYVQPGTILATLVRREPLLLRFHVPEQDAGRIRVGAPVSFRVRNDEHEYRARIIHVAAFADEKTRMVATTAEITDAQRSMLRPGAFAEIRIPVGGERLSPVIPQTAIRPSERGFLVYIVEGNIARERIVTLGLRTEDGFIEVLAGLKAGERLVVRGAEALYDGASVRISDGKKAGKNKNVSPGV
ncbi:MAG: efflux RND transporter periplasmic adaptor subunit [Bacteroidota bacterium]|nr:efflux RND transporter periplasmic adaptor subunit [Bacteroidota bacterium]